MQMRRAISDYSNKNECCGLASMVPQLREQGGRDLYRSLLIMKMLEENDPELESELGDCYYQGDGLYQDEARAIEKFKSAAAKGSIRAHYDLAWLYYDKGEYLRAIEYFRYCISQKEYFAEKKLQNCYCCLGDAYTRLAEPNITLAVENLVIASEKYHDSYAARRLALLYSDANSKHFDPEKSVRYYELAAVNGDAPAASIIAVCYIYGDDELKVPKNCRKAESILLPFVEVEDADTSRALGLLYMEQDKNTNFHPDYHKAKRYLEKSWSINRSTNVAANLGYVSYLVNDFSLAEKMLVFAAEDGNYMYVDFLGRIYRDGLGVVPNLEKAAHYYDLAFRTESMNNVFTAGEYSELLEELERYEKAYDVAEKGAEKYHDIWFVFLKAKLVLTLKVSGRISLERASEDMELCLRYKSHEKEAHVLLGDYYLQSRDFRRAEGHYLDAFSLGSADAAVYLGRLYEHGGGTIRSDINKAVEWYQKASAAGSQLGATEESCFKKGLFGGYKRIRGL